MNNLDLTIFYALHNFTGRSFWLDWIIHIVAQYLPYVLVIAFIYAAYLSLQFGKSKIAMGYIVALASSCVALGILEIIRYVYPHPRPFVALHFIPLFLENSSSFPSGHATFFFALSTGAYFMNKKIGIALYLFTVLICISRIAAGVHYPSDIVGGAVLGVFTAYLLFKIGRLLEKKQKIA